METFLFSLNAILPIVLLVALGYFLKKINILTPEFLKQANKLCFKLFLPVTLFFNIYKIGGIGDIDFKIPLYAVLAIIVSFFIGFVLVKIFVKDDRQKGACWQCVFRSNYAIIGIPLSGLILGPEAEQVASILSAFVIPTFNVLAIISLSVYNNDGSKPEIKKILKGIAKNPLIHGVLIGVLFLLIRLCFVRMNVSFRLSQVDFLYKSLQYLNGCTTPVALIVLGGQFEFSTFKSSKVAIFVGTFARLIIVPFSAILVACLCFGFRGAAVVAFISAFGSPVAVSSAIMAQEMNSDGELAGTLVMTTTLFSVISLTLLIAMVKGFGFI